MPSLVAIQEIWIDDARRLCVRTSASFPYIYRSAAEVHWDASGEFLYSPPPREWSYAQWLQHIIGAVQSEYGQRLVATPETNWEKLPPAVQSELHAAVLALN